jgi:hypothetical protein
MANFPQDYLASAPAVIRSATLLGDDGQKNGVYNIAQILSLINLQDFYPKLLTADDVLNPIPATTTDLTLVLTGTGSHKNKLNVFLNTGACVVRVPAGATEGAVIPWVQWAAGQLTFDIVAGTNQVIRPEFGGGKKSAGLTSSGALRYMGNNEWHLFGNTVV